MIKNKFGITYKATVNYIKIYFRGLLHLQFREKELTGFQSWIENENCYCLELYFKNDSSILVEYNQRGKFEIISSILDELVF